jgi:mRNA interferase MazF
MAAFGAILLARFPFTDLSGDKRRPVLVVSRNNGQRNDLVVCFITSVPRSGPDMALLPASAETGLKTLSTVRFDKIATLEVSTFSGTLGRAPADWLRDHADAFFGVFGFARSAVP